MLPFPLFLACKYLRPKRTVLSVVTVLSMLGVLLGVAILIIVLSVMSGFDRMWREKILSFKPHLTVTSPYGTLVNEEELCRRIEVLPGITGVAPVVVTRVLLRHGERTAAPVVIGLDAARARGISRIPEKIIAGTFRLDDESMTLGIDLAAQLNLVPNERGLLYSSRSVVAQDEFYLPEELAVSGIFDMGMRDYDAEFVLTSLEVARDLVGLDRGGVHALYVMTDDPMRYTAHRERLQEELGFRYRVSSWEDEDRVLLEAIKTEKSLMFILLAFIAVVAVFCVTNTLIVVTVQKTREIGLLKALGFANWRIMAAFVCFGWIQCLVGILGGIAVSLLILFNLKGIVRALAALNMEVFPKHIYGLSEIPSVISRQEILAVSLLVLGFCTLSSLFPAWRAARLDPVEALRHE
jgi:lipoprotein-releasing system permease protein